MSFYNLYAKSVSNGTLGSPALSADITDGFFKWSLDPRTHSIKSETTYNNLAGYLVVDDSIWEVYEGATGDPILHHKPTGDVYNTLTDVIITKRNDTFSIELIKNGALAANRETTGLAIRDGRNLRAIDITQFQATT